MHSRTLNRIFEKKTLKKVLKTLENGLKSAFFTLF